MSRYLVPLVAFVVGCGVQGTVTIPAPKSTPAPVASAEGKKWLLSTEPAAAKGVLAVREAVKDGEEVVVIGQVGGAAKPFTEGRASFLIVDPSLKPTDGCETPWDFCEYKKTEVAAARLLVKFVDGVGKTVKGEPRELFGIKELSAVVVTGKVQRDDKDNVVVVASGMYVR